MHPGERAQPEHDIYQRWEGIVAWSQSLATEGANDAREDMHDAVRDAALQNHTGDSSLFDLWYHVANCIWVAATATVDHRPEEHHNMRYPAWFFFLAVLTLAPVAIPAQVPTQPPDPLRAAEVLELVREGRGGSLAASFLTQEDQPRPAGELDAFADSLVAIAISYRRGDPREVHRAAHYARLALMWSAKPDRVAERAASLAQRGLGPPVPYPRAFDALVRVFEGSEVPGVKGVTLGLMTNLPDTARAIAFLSEVATDPSMEPGISIVAVRRLAGATGDAGLSHLRMLFETDAVPNPTVRRRLEVMARSRGWVREGGG